MTVLARDRRAAIGTFVLGGLILALAAIVLFGNFDLFSPRRRAAVVFDGSISGLTIGAPVSFRGVRVGAVERIVIQVDPRTHTFYIPVTVQLEPDRIRLGGDDSANAGEDLEPIEWWRWFKVFDERLLQLVYDPSKGWFTLGSRLAPSGG